MKNKKLKTLRDLEEPVVNDEICNSNIVESDDLRELAKEWIKYLKNQEKLHWRYVSMSIGENPSCEVPKGLDFISFLPHGYDTIVKFIKNTFNLEDDKNEK